MESALRVSRCALLSWCIDPLAGCSLELIVGGDLRIRHWLSRKAQIRLKCTIFVISGRVDNSLTEDSAAPILIKKLKLIVSALSDRQLAD